MYECPHNRSRTHYNTYVIGRERQKFNTGRI